MIYISYESKEDKERWKEYRELLKQNIKKSLAFYKIKKSIFLVLTSSHHMILKNKEYRKQESDTNVLSLVMEEDPICLGEIILSFEKIHKEFVEKNLPGEPTTSYKLYDSFEHYLLFILTHGFLHLLNYDHSTDLEESLMNREQERLLSWLVK